VSAGGRGYLIGGIAQEYAVVVVRSDHAHPQGRLALLVVHSLEPHAPATHPQSQPARPFLVLLLHGLLQFSFNVDKDIFLFIFEKKRK
jgi:hypothetical protein